MTQIPLPEHMQLVALERLMQVLEEVDATLSGTVIIRYPEPVYVNTCRSMEAEAIAKFTSSSRSWLTMVCG